MWFLKFCRSERWEKLLSLEAYTAYGFEHTRPAVQHGGGSIMLGKFFLTRDMEADLRGSKSISRANLKENLLEASKG